MLALRSSLKRRGIFPRRFILRCLAASGKHECRKAPRAKALPFIFWLRQSIRDRISDHRVGAEPAVASKDLDIFALSPGRVAACLPCAYPITPAENRSRGHRERRPEFVEHRAACPIVHFIAAGRFVNSPGVRRLRPASKRRSQSDDLPDRRRQPLGHQSGENAAKAPADQADPAPRLFEQTFDHCRQPRAIGSDRTGPKIAAKLPCPRIESEVSEDGAQRGRGPVASEKAREDKHWMSIAARRQGEERRRGAGEES